MKRYLLISSLAIAVLGLFQFIFLPDTRFLYWLGWDDHLNRLISTTFDPGFTGVLLVFGFILTLTPSKSFTKPLLANNHLQQAILLISIALTYSRAAYLTLFCVLLAHIFRAKKIVFASTIGLIFLLTLFFLPRTQGAGVRLERTASITQRITSTQTAFSLFLQHPILGIGYNNYQSVIIPAPSNSIPMHPSAPDNSLIQLLVTTGMVGASLYVFWLLKAFKWAYTRSNTIFLTLTALTIHSLTNNTLFYSFVSIWFWLLFAVELRKK